MENFIILLLIASVLFVAIEVLQRKVFTKILWSRKATHISLGLFVLILPYYLSKWEIALMALIFTITLLVSRMRHILSLHNIKRYSWGEVFYPISVGFLAMICLPENINAFYAGILCLALSDASAAMVGGLMPIKQIRFGKHTKTVGGMAGFFVVTICIFSFIYLPLGASFFTLMIISLILSFSELITFYGSDNLVVPILASVMAIWWL
jgi:phytol kinase